MDTIQNINYWKDRAIKAEQELNKARIDSTFNIYSRYGIESIIKELKDKKVYVLFVDLDDIHILNEKYGYQKVDKKIKIAFSKLKAKICGDEYLARWYSGDEWILISRINPTCYVDYIFSCFHSHNIKLTIALNYTTNFSGKLGDIVYPASKKVQASKNHNIKNRYLGSVQ